MDDGKEFVVMRFCVKYWKRSLREAAFYSEPGKVKHPKKWEWSLATEVEAMVRKHPVIDEEFCATLLVRAQDLDTHPLVTLTVAFCVFWSMYEDGDEHKANAQASEAFFAAQRADPYLNGVLDGMMYSALYALAELGCALLNALLLKPVRQGTARETMPFFPYVNTTGEVIVNTQSFEIIKALMWLAGFKEITFARGVTKWVPIASGEMALPIVQRLVGIEALKTGINPLVKIETRVNRGCIIKNLINRVYTAFNMILLCIEPLADIMFYNLLTLSRMHFICYILISRQSWIYYYISN